MDAVRQHWEDMYSLPVEDIPWEISKPPGDLVEALDTVDITRGMALDVGCGTGHYSFYLARQGFDVVGIDLSKKALKLAEERNSALGLSAVFRHGYATQLVKIIDPAQCDFVLDYNLLHHLEPGAVESYAAQFPALLNDKGVLLLVCYSDKDNHARGLTMSVGKYGNHMHYRSRQQIEEMYSDLTLISYRETRIGKRLHHVGHSFIFRKTS